MKGCLAPLTSTLQAGFEPATRWLTAICSTTELLKIFLSKKVEDGIEPSLSDLQSHTLAIMLLNLKYLLLCFLYKFDCINPKKPKYPFVIQIYLND